MTLSILVVDDEVCCRMSNIMACKRAFDNPDIKIGFDGKHAISELRTFAPDLILTDFHMGSMNGDQFVMEIKKEFPELKCPIVLVTGDPYQGDNANFYTLITAKGNFDWLVEDLKNVMQGRKDEISTSA